MHSKVFLISEFGSPFSWTDKYIENVAKLGQYGWYWKIFTPNKYENVPPNVEIVNMTIEQYAELVEKKLGIKPNFYITDKGTPSIHITDFYIFSGVVFEDYIKDFDFWGITNMDVVYGRLDHYLPDEYFRDCDVFTDDVNAINGVFCLFRNRVEINNLFRFIPNWENILKQNVCQKCITGEGEHKLYVSDEFMMTDVMKSLGDKVRYKYPPYDPLHSYDRLEQHQPKPKLEIKSDGSLYENFNDVFKLKHDPNFTKGHRGKEIMYFHFSYTKKWPL